MSLAHLLRMHVMDAMLAVNAFVENTKASVTVAEVEQLPINYVAFDAPLRFRN